MKRFTLMLALVLSICFVLSCSYQKDEIRTVEKDKTVNEISESVAGDIFEYDDSEKPEVKAEGGDKNDGDPVVLPTEKHELEFIKLSGKEEYGIKIGTYNESSLIVPATYNQLPITEILEDAFKNNKTLTSITIGANIVRIGAGAFTGSNVVSVILEQKSGWHYEDNGTKTVNSGYSAEQIANLMINKPYTYICG